MSEINTQRRATKYFVNKWEALINQLGIDKAREEADRIMTEELTDRPPAKYDKNDTLSWHNEHNLKVARLAYDYKFDNIPLPIASDTDSIILEKVKKAKLLEAKLREIKLDRTIAELELQLKDAQYEKELDKNKDKEDVPVHQSDVQEEIKEEVEVVAKDDEAVAEILTTATPKAKTTKTGTSAKKKTAKKKK